MAIPSLIVLNVAPIPSLSEEINKVRLDTAKIVSEHIIPNEAKLGGAADPAERDQLIHELREYVKDSDLWAPHLPKEYGGMGIGFLGHAYMNEILAWSPYSNYIFGVQAPTSGNQSVLIKYGTSEQKKEFLEPTIRGEQTSCFSMTCLLYTSPSPRDLSTSRMPSSA